MKGVPGFSDYKVDKSGNVTKDGKKMSKQVSDSGYEYVKLSKGGKTHTVYIHRLLADIFLDGKSPGDIVNHKDGNKRNNCLSNLEWASHADNISHAFDNDLEVPPNGERNGKSKISDADAVAIRKAVDGGAKKADLAKKYGISPAMVSRMTTGGTDKSPARRQKDGSDDLHNEGIVAKLDDKLKRLL